MLTDAFGNGWPESVTRDVDGEMGAMALYAGQSVDHVTRIQPAAEIVAELTATTWGDPSHRASARAALM